MFRSTATRALTVAAALRRSATSATALSLRPTSYQRSILARVGQRHFSETAQSLAKKCPTCGTLLPTPLLACPNCYHIAPLPQSTTFHELLGLSHSPNAFDVEPSILKDRFRQLQRVIHPDKWSNQGHDAQDLAAGMSSVVNKAYGTLLNPFTRAEYILQLEGIEIGESDNVDDPELIMEIMDAREGLDSAETQEEVEQIRQDNADKITEILPHISASVAAKDWAAVKREAVKLKYLQGIDAAAEAWPNRVHDH